MMEYLKDKETQKVKILDEQNCSQNIRCFQMLRDPNAVRELISNDPHLSKVDEILRAF